jgi:hypothetical protein
MDKDKNQTGESAQAAIAAQANGHDASTPSTNKAFRSYEENLRKVEIPNAITKFESASIIFATQRLMRWKKKCVLQKASETLDFYQALNDNIGVFARKDASEIKNKIDKAIADSDVVGAKLKTVFGSLKAAKGKLFEVRGKGDDLFHSLSDSKFSDNVADLSKVLKDATPKNSNDNADNFKTYIERLRASSKHCFDLVDDAVEVSIKIAGIHANASINTLKDPSTEMVAKVEALQSDIVDNVTNAQTKRAAGQKEYEAVMNELVTAKYAKYATGLNVGGLLETVSQVDEPDCKEWSHDKIRTRLDQYASQVEGNLKKIT